MYHLESAIGKPYNNNRWKDIDIGSVPMATLYATYTKAYAILTNAVLDHQVSLNLEDIRAEFGGQTITFNDMLISIADRALPTSDTLPVINTKYVKYNDVFKAGYAVEPISPTASADADIAEEDKTWLHLTRDNTDYTLFSKSILAIVNGFFHLTDANANGAYVINGYQSALLSKKNQMGLLSFGAVGEITQVPITTDMIYKQDDTLALKDGCYLDIGQDIAGKIVMVVIGGYLHVLDNQSIKQIGDQTFRFDWNNIPLMDRYYESVNNIDLSSLTLNKGPHNPTQIVVEELFSDANLKAYLTLSQSFFVILDSDELFTEVYTPRKAEFAFYYTAWESPSHLFITGAGRASCYLTVKEGNQWIVTADDVLNSNRLFNTVNAREQLSVDDSRIPDDPVERSNAFFLKIGKDV